MHIVMDKILIKIKKIIPKKLFKALQPTYHFFLSWISALISCWPSEKLIVIGVTGTTGKTTSVYLIAKMLEGAGYKVGFTSTAMFNDGRKEWLNDKKMTMVGRLFTQRILRRMIKNECQYAIVETTSEGIIQFRHRFINYDILVFTGLYPEHIDRHGSFANYQKAKEKLFAHLKKCGTKYVNEKKRIIKSDSGIKKIDLTRVKKTIIVDGNDKYAENFLSFWADEKMAYVNKDKFAPEFDKSTKIIKYNNIKTSSNSTYFTTFNIEIKLQLLGGFNVGNAMTAVCVGLTQDLNINQIKKGLESVEGVAGRLEKIDEGQRYVVIVDYAFEPGAVRKLYETIKLIPHKKLIHVLGSAGGGRDIARRPKLGQLAGKAADYIVITNEDPYDENPSIIIDQVSLGVEKTGKELGKDLFKILDRREAIKKALFFAEEGDLVLITGKGSEQSICIAGGEKIPWDDRAVVRSLLNSEK
jgi:UDP-N-acetylmuramoyl-L-alanyl-D-glutamate--2,6-diaminopimelate ligase